jgi:hypothetical protein
MALNYLLIALVMAVLIAPIMALKPSRRQKQIVMLRDQARRLGMHVQFVLEPITDVNDLHPASVRYMLPRKKEYDEGEQRFESWFLVRDNGNGRPSRWPGWLWRGQVPSCDDQTDLEETLLAVPADVNGLCSDRQGLSAYWQERGGPEEIETIKMILKNIQDISNR